MSNLKCPFCQQELEDATLWDCYACRNPNCKHLLGYGTKELWQALDRTKKQLEIAIDALDTISQITNQIDVCDTAEDAINQIKALEQKE